MPQIQVTTRGSEQIWKSPDGQRVIYKVTLEHDGQEVTAKTYSHDIAQVSWSGTVESYEKEGRNGAETFVKQPQKEGFHGGGGGGGGGAPRASVAGGGRQPFDNYTMYLSYGKDLAIACVKDGKFDDKLYSDVLAAVEAGGAQLYASRPDAPKTADNTKSELDKVFGETEDVTPKEKPWAPQLTV